MVGKKTSKIPKFKTLEEEARFWDTHSLVDFDGELKDVSVVVDLARPKEETLVLRVQKGVKDKLVRAAKKQGLSVSSLARMWLTEKLRTC